MSVAMLIASARNADARSSTSMRQSARLKMMQSHLEPPVLVILADYVLCLFSGQ